MQRTRQSPVHPRRQVWVEVTRPSRGLGELQAELEAAILDGVTVSRSTLARFVRLAVRKHSKLIADYAADALAGNPRRPLKKGRPRQSWDFLAGQILAILIRIRHHQLKKNGVRDAFNAALEQISEENGFLVSKLKRWYREYKPEDEIEEVISNFRAMLSTR